MNCRLGEPQQTRHLEGVVADSLSTSRMTQQEGQEESDQQEDRNDEWFVNWNRPHG